MDLHATITRITGTSPATADLDTCRTMLADLATVERWVVATRIAWHARLESLADATPSVLPEQVNATATRRSSRAAAADARRAAALSDPSPFQSAFAAGTVGVEHLDAVTDATRDLDPSQRQRLLADPSLVLLAGSLTPEQFRVAVRDRVRRLLTDDGIAKAERQRRSNSFRSWADAGSGMIRFTGQLDPETGTRFLNRINTTTQELFGKPIPADCPTDPDARQAWLRMMALVELTEGRGASVGAPEIVVVIDADTIDGGVHDQTVIWHQHDIDLPVASIRRLLCTGVVSPVITRNGQVLDVGRASRLATPAQRRALRMLHPTCGIPGCAVRYDLCQPHHLVWWRHDGLTDLDNLLPLCGPHHHAVHEGGWRLQLTPGTRELLVTLPDGTTMSNAPPTTRAG